MQFGINLGLARYGLQRDDRRVPSLFIFLFFLHKGKFFVASNGVCHYVEAFG